jgi:three-Cys-motif partner protein
VRSLEQEIQRLPGVANLKYPPKIWNAEVGSEIARQFASHTKVPTLAFIDPWGYKGLSLELVNAFLKDWGCDCIFFFNYSRINAGLSNPMVREHMAALFGEERADRLREELDPMSSAEREATIVNELALALKQYGHRYVLPFTFKSESGKRTTHHLILVTKHFRGYEVMKDIMAKSSSEADCTSLVLTRQSVLRAGVTRLG